MTREQIATAIYAAMLGKSKVQYKIKAFEAVLAADALLEALAYDKGQLKQASMFGGKAPY